jgi:hypothetical protein
MDGASLGRRVPDRCVPTLDQFRLGNVAYGHLTSQTDWKHKMLVKFIDSFASTASTHRLRDASSKGRIIHSISDTFFIRGHTSEGRNNIAQRLLLSCHVEAMLSKDQQTNIRWELIQLTRGCKYYHVRDPI